MPYNRLMSATKARLLRTGSDLWIQLGNPNDLRQELDDEPVLPWCRHQRSVSIAPDRPELSTGRLSGRAAHLEKRRQDPPYWSVRGQPQFTHHGPADHRDCIGPEHVKLVGPSCRTTFGCRDRLGYPASSCGSRWLRDHWRLRAAQGSVSSSSPTITQPGRSWRWPGC